MIFSTVASENLLEVTGGFIFLHICVSALTTLTFYSFTTYLPRLKAVLTELYMHLPPFFWNPLEITNSPPIYDVIILGCIDTAR